MQRFCIAALLCSVAFVAYASASASETAAAQDETNKLSLTPSQAMKILASDSSAASYAFDKETYPSTGSSRYGYTHRKKKSHKRHSSPSPSPAHTGYEHKHKHHDDDDDEYKTEGTHKKETYGDDHPKAPPSSPHPHKYDYKHSEAPPSSPHPHKKHTYSSEDYKTTHKDSHKKHKDSDKDYETKDKDPKKKTTKKEEEEYKEEYETSEYEKGVKVCLQEISRTPSTYPDASIGTPSGPWRSYFACCEEIAKKNEYEIKDSIVPDASKLAEMMTPPTPIGFCNWTAMPVPTGMGGQAPIMGRVGSAYAECEITATSTCFPLPKGSKFKTDMTDNYSHWLELPAALSNKQYSFGVYPASADSSATVAAVEPAAAPAVTYDEEYEYEYQPAVVPIPAVVGAVDHFAAMLASSPGVIKGGSLHYTAGFVDKNGAVLCPANAIPATVSRPTADGMHLPVVKCGEYKLRLWLAPSSGPYYGYDGKKNYPPGSEPYYGTDGYYGDEGYYKDGVFDGEYDGEYKGKYDGKYDGKYRPSTPPSTPPTDGYYAPDGSYYMPEGRYYKPDGTGPYEHDPKNKPVDYHYKTGSGTPPSPSSDYKYDYKY